MIRLCCRMVPHRVNARSYIFPLKTKKPVIEAPPIPKTTRQSHALIDASSSRFDSNMMEEVSESYINFVLFSATLFLLSPL